MGPKKLTRAAVHTKRKNLISENSDFALVEAYKTARTNMMFSLAAASSKVVVFTSCAPVEGKSMTCVNMALALAQTGSNVLVIDADMRKPTIHSLLRITSSKGLSTVLGKFCGLEKALEKDVYPNLDVMIAGTIPPNPAELLASSQMGELLSVLESHYDFIPAGFCGQRYSAVKQIDRRVCVYRPGRVYHPWGD